MLQRTRKCFEVCAGDFNLELGSRTLIMGIINLTPDSFSDDGLLKKGSKRSLLIKRSFELAKRIVKQGADIIDIGAESSRPGAKPISAKEEIKRIVPVVIKITQNLKVPVSIDTYKAEVAEAAIEAGASIINNIMGTNPKFNKRLAKICAKKNKALIIMHIRGRPLNMQKFTKYKSLISDIIGDLKKGIRVALSCGLNQKSIIIDPGIGFAKTYKQNLEIINRLDEFASLDKPILIGVSRKSFIGKVLSQDERKRIWGTASSVALSLVSGAHIVRVHDVGKMYDVVRMTDAILNPKILN